MQEDLHLASVSKDYGNRKRTVKYKASKMWNRLPASLKELFSSVGHVSNKLKQFMQPADMILHCGHVCFVFLVYVCRLSNFEQFCAFLSFYLYVSSDQYVLCSVTCIC